MTTSPTTIIAYASEDGRYAALAGVARETARASGARLILYDIDAASLFTAPRPTQWSGEGAEENFPRVLLPEDLEGAGRAALSRQVRDARTAGIDAYGWLPKQKGADALADYADEQHADLIIVPHDLVEPAMLDRLRGASLAHATEKTGRPIVVVKDTGESEYQ